MTSFFGKYQVVELVGEGGFGKVFKGYDPTLKRYVAIKTCTLRHPDIRARFTREAEIAANLRHPNIVTVYDFGEHEGEPYLVQEFLSGEDLDRIIKRADPVDVQTKIRYLSQLAEGLAFAHRYGVVHRDVKPGNVRIQTDGQVRIMDFGIAKLLEADQQLTQTGLSVGTTGYLAPEQLMGQDIDHRADIFSYGVLAYELVAGRRPFEGESITSIFYKIAHEEPAPVTELAPGCPPRLAAIIDRCLKKNREERFAHLGLVKDELDVVAAELKTGVAAPTSAAATGSAGASAAFSAAAAPPAPADGAPAQAAATAPPAAAPAGTAATAPARASRWRTYGGLAVAAAAVAIFAVFSVARWGRGSAGPDGAAAGGAAVASAEAGGVAAAGAPAGPAAGAPPAAATGAVATAIGPNAGAGAAGPATPAMGSAPGSPPATSAGAAPAGAAPTASAAGAPAASGGAAASPAGAAPAGAAGRASPPAPAKVSRTDPAAAAAGTPRAPASKAAPALSRTRVLALVQGPEDGGAGSAEAALLAELLANDLQVVDQNDVSEVQENRATMRAATAGDGSRIAELGRQFGAGTVLVGSIRGQAVPSVGQFFTGSAFFTVKMYDATSGRLVAVETFQVGGGQTPGKLGPTPEAAVSEAAAEVGRQAARAAARRFGAN